MVFNLNTVKQTAKKEPFKLVSAALGLALFVVSFFWYTSPDLNKRALKTSINDNFEKIDSLRGKTAAYTERFRLDSVAMRTKDALIQKLKTKADAYLVELEIIKNQNEKTKTNYINRDVNDRFLLFSDLTTAQD